MTEPCVNNTNPKLRPKFLKEKFYDDINDITATTNLKRLLKHLLLTMQIIVSHLKDIVLNKFTH